MKTKKSRKLTLNKETIAHLNGRAMKNLVGGVDTDLCTVTCQTCALCGDTANCPLTDGETSPWCDASDLPTACPSGGVGCVSTLCAGSIDIC